MTGFKYLSLILIYTIMSGKLADQRHGTKWLDLRAAFEEKVKK